LPRLVSGAVRFDADAAKEGSNLNYLCKLEMEKLKTLLIANRGEIAVRDTRRGETCRDVLVTSQVNLDADADVIVFRCDFVERRRGSTYGPSRYTRKQTQHRNMFVTLMRRYCCLGAIPPHTRTRLLS
jgi:hypothetical protein